MKRKICFITGSRAEYGLLRPVIEMTKKRENLLVQVIATGSHLSADFGNTFTEIEEDGFNIDVKVPILDNIATHGYVSSAVAQGIVKISMALDSLEPDMVVLLGDRYEILAAAQAAMFIGIPVAHIGGGDNGEGTYDNIIRHCVSKIASLHFVTHQQARSRVLQLGEADSMVFDVGSTCVDNIKNEALLSDQELRKNLDLPADSPYHLVTYHPLTMSERSYKDELQELLQAIEVRMAAHTKEYFVVTKANADPGGLVVNKIIEGFAARHARFKVFTSLGRVKYLSAIKFAKSVVGNSSSGIYEAPYLQTPTVDVGDRQKGREAPLSVFHTTGVSESILAAWDRALKCDFSSIQMIYGDGDSAIKVVDIIEEHAGRENLHIKKFIDRSFV